MYIYMEENTAPKIDLVDPNADQSSQANTISRRDFLKAALTFSTAAVLAACSPNTDIKASKSEEENFRDNVDTLNNQYTLREKTVGPFNYDRYIDEYPGFEKYVEYIDKTSEVVQGETGITQDVIKTLISSVIATHYNNWDEIDPNRSLVRQKVGPMQFYPGDISGAIKKRYNKKFEYTDQQIYEPYFNMLLGSIYIMNSLAEIENDGQNNDMMQLVLAKYYDSSAALINLVKQNKNIKGFEHSNPNFILYQKNIQILGLQSENIQENSEEKQNGVDTVWSSAIEYWPHTKIKENKDVFYQQVEKYYTDELNVNPKLSRKELLSIFISVAMVESNGGLKKESPISGAIGWYQLIPRWRHLEDFNSIHGTQYTYQELHDNDKVSVEVGTWTLMRYRNSMDIHQSMKFFKGGNTFGYNQDDGIWWNRVSYCTKNLLEEDKLGMGYMDYYYNNVGFSKSEFEKNRQHIANVYINKD